MYLHYHDYLLDGRWVLTPGLDDDDRTALVCRLLKLWTDTLDLKSVYVNHQKGFGGVRTQFL